MGGAAAFQFASCLKQRTADERSLLGENNQPLAVYEAVLSKSRSPSLQQLVAARMERVIGRTYQVDGDEAPDGSEHGFRNYQKCGSSTTRKSKKVKGTSSMTSKISCLSILELLESAVYSDPMLVRLKTIFVFIGLVGELRVTELRSA